MINSKINIFTDEEIKEALSNQKMTTDSLLKKENEPLKPVTLSFSDKAIKVIKKSVDSEKDALGIRFTTKKYGCSGQAYVMEITEKVGDNETLHLISGLNVIIDNNSLIYLNGLHVDYKKNGLNKGFEFTNPNSKGKCGCGESFAF